MANALTDVRKTLPTPYLPPHVAALAAAVGTVQHLGQPIRYDLPERFTRTLTPQIREEASKLISTYTSILDPEFSSRGRSGGDARSVVIASLLMGMSVGSVSEMAADARLDLYEIALDDVPAWAVSVAVRKWVRRECPSSIEKSPNYSFAPSPATLRALSLAELEPYRKSLRALKALISAEPTGAALNPAPRASAGQSLAAGALRRM